MISRLSIAQLVLLANILFAFHFSGVLAAEPIEPDAAEPDPIELDTIQVVTASRTGENIDQAMASVSVISASDIQRSVAQDLLELLRLEAGVDMVRSGGAGAQTSLFMRGSNSNHTLVLIDGIRVASANTGAYAWEQLPLNQVERIEIVRGPRASLFGSDAIGGVIQIFTRHTDTPYFRITVGSFSTGEVEAGTGFELETARFSISAGYRDSGGFSAQNTGGFSYHPDNDGFKSKNLGISGSGDTADGSWQLRIMALDNEVEFDQGVSESGQLFVSLGRDGELRDGWSYRLRAGIVDEQLDSDFGFFTTGFKSRRLDAGWENHAQFDRGSLAFGLDYYNESGAATGTYDENRYNSALFAMWDQTAGTARVQLSTRLDKNSVFGSELTYQAALRFTTGAQGEFLGLWGTAFRAPTLGEQYSPGFGGLFAGNPMLEPESSTSLELIYRLGLGNTGRVSVSVYQTDVDQLIAFSGADFQAVNINAAQLRGVEIEYSLEWADWRLKSNATLQHTQDRSTGEALLRRPEQKASLTINRAFGRGSWLGAEWFVSGDRLDFGGQVLPGYALLNLAGGYRLSQAFSVALRVDNLLDRDYEPAAGFNSAERSAFLSLNWNP